MDRFRFAAFRERESKRMKRRVTRFSSNSELLPRRKGKKGKEKEKKEINVARVERRKNKLREGLSGWR